MMFVGTSGFAGAVWGIDNTYVMEPTVYFAVQNFEDCYYTHESIDLKPLPGIYVTLTIPVNWTSLGAIMQLIPSHLLMIGISFLG